jgi:hypothetical protein
MYRKDARRHIAREVSKLLAEMRAGGAWADWRMALMATQCAHPDWFKHGETAESLEQFLRESGVDVSTPPKPFRFVGNASPDN